MPTEMTPPTKPRLRSLQTIAKNVRFMPYLIDGDTEGYDLDTEKGLTEAIEDSGNFFVLLAPLKYKSYLNYEIEHGNPLEADANRILYVLASVYGMLKDAEGQEIKLELDDDKNIITPYGSMKGSLDRNMTDLVIFILSQHGRIVGLDDNGTFMCKRVTKEDIIDHLDPRAVSKIGEDDGQSLFMEILEISGVYVPDEAKASLVAAGEVEADEAPKASPAPKNVRKSTPKQSVVVSDSKP